jgi:hypothetical protein
MNQWRTSRLKGTIQGPSAQQHSRISEHQRMRVWHKQLDSMLKPVLSLTIREGAARLATGPKAMPYLRLRILQAHLLSRHPICIRLAIGARRQRRNEDGSL